MGSGTGKNSKTRSGVPNGGRKWPLEDVLQTLAGRVLSGAAIVAFIAVIFTLLAWLLDLRALVAKGGIIALSVTFGVILLMGFAMVIGVLVAFIPAIRDLTKRTKDAEAQAAGAEQKLRTQQTQEPFAEAVRGVIKGHADGAPGVMVWSRLVPRIKLPESTSQELRKLLEQVRERGYMTLNESLGNLAIPAMDMRANIFLPDTREAEAGEVCGLFIPDDLHINMQNRKELELVFRPNEGLVGKVFATSAAEGAFLDSATGEWIRVSFGGPSSRRPGDLDYRLTDQQRALIDPDLKWIVSVPLLVQDGSRSAAVGVVNVDCLKREITPELMKDVYIAIVGIMPALATSISKSSLDRVAIVVQRSG
jgi:hypothetical protein